MQTFLGVNAMRKNRNTPGREIAEGIERSVRTDVWGRLNGEMTGYLGYESNDKGEKKTENRQGGFSPKTIKTSMGELEISVPRDRNASVGDFAVSATFP